MIGQIKKPPSQTIVNIKDCILKLDLFGTEIGSDDGMCRTEYKIKCTLHPASSVQSIHSSVLYKRLLPPICPNQNKTLYTIALQTTEKKIVV